MQRLILLFGVVVVFAGCTTSPPPVSKGTITSFDRPTGRAGERFVEPGGMKFHEADLEQVFTVYQDLSGRTVVRSPQVPRNVKLTFQNKTALNRVEALQLLDTLLAQNGIVMVFAGQDMVKAIPAAAAPTEAGPVIDLPPEQLPDSKSFMLRAVKLKKARVEEVVSMISPFSSLPNSIVAVRGSNTLYLRDYSSNIRQMLRVISDAENR